MFQLFSYKELRSNVIKLLRYESRVTIAYEDTIIEHGAPNRIITDNTKVSISDKFRSISKKYCIATSNTVPECQHQNYCEGEGGNFKFAVCK